jgi:hypothetical protein
VGVRPAVAMRERIRRSREKPCTTQPTRFVRESLILSSAAQSCHVSSGERLDDVDLHAALSRAEAESRDPPRSCYLLVCDSLRSVTTDDRLGRFSIAPTEDQNTLASPWRKQ